MAEKAKIYVEKQREPIEVMFNPEDYNITREAKFSTSQGQQQFIGFEFQPFVVSLFYDTYEKGSYVREKYADKIAKLTEPIIEGKDSRRPPECIFTWGSFAIKGVIQKVDQKFTMFLQNGTPVRVLITITFNPTVSSKEVDKLKWEACRKIWTVKSGDRLDLIAYRTLKDPSGWRNIAKTNNINNPMIFPTDADIGEC